MISQLERYKKRFHKDEWEKLTEDKDFNFAFNTGDFNAAGLIASRILHGEARNTKEFKTLMRRKRVLDEFR